MLRKGKHEDINITATISRISSSSHFLDSLQFIIFGSFANEKTKDNLVRCFWSFMIRKNVWVMKYFLDRQTLNDVRRSFKGIICDETIPNLLTMFISYFMEQIGFLWWWFLSLPWLILLLLCEAESLTSIPCWILWEALSSFT